MTAPSSAPAPVPRSRFWAFLLKSFGWSPLLIDNRPPQSVMAVAPHTSNWDFIIGLVYYLAYYGRPNFLIKKEWFVFPLNYLFKSLGGVSVNREQGLGTVRAMADAFGKNPILHLAITPEGTRAYTRKWKTGFLRIALQADVPIEITKIDYKRKEVGILEVYRPTGNLEEDLDYIRSFFSKEMAKYPRHFHGYHSHE